MGMILFIVWGIKHIEWTSCFCLQGDWNESFSSIVCLFQCKDCWTDSSFGGISQGQVWFHPIQKKIRSERFISFFSPYYIILFWVTLYNMFPTEVRVLLPWPCCVEGEDELLFNMLHALYHRSLADDSVVVILYTLTYSSANQSPQKQKLVAFHFCSQHNKVSVCLLFFHRWKS